MIINSKKITLIREKGPKKTQRKINRKIRSRSQRRRKDILQLRRKKILKVVRRQKDHLYFQSKLKNSLINLLPH